MARPRPPALIPLVEGVDYYCGLCSGRQTIPCEYCVHGDDMDGVKCYDCEGTGLAQCPECKGGTVPMPPPEWLSPRTPQPPRCHHAESGEKPGAEGAGRVDTEASRLRTDSIAKP